MIPTIPTMTALLLKASHLLSYQNSSLGYSMFLPAHLIQALKDLPDLQRFPQPPYLISYASDQVQKTMLKSDQTLRLGTVERWNEWAKFHLFYMLDT